MPLVKMLFIFSLGEIRRHHFCFFILKLFKVNLCRQQKGISLSAYNLPAEGQMVRKEEEEEQKKKKIQEEAIVGKSR